MDREDRVLLVQEAKPASRDKWNLPGGHVDHGESPVTAAMRETLEETKLDLTLHGLVGIYAGPRSVRFVFRTDIAHLPPSPGDEILAVRFFTLDEIVALPESEVVSPAMMKRIVEDLRSDRTFPLEIVRHIP